MQKAVREALTSKKADAETDTFGTHGSGDDDDDDEDDEAKFDARMRSQILRKRIELGDTTAREKPGKIFHTTTVDSLVRFMDTFFLKLS